jgi:tRNA modification GTPase
MRVSCLSGEGVGELRERLAAVVQGDLANLGGRVAIGARHRAALARARRELEGGQADQVELLAEAARWALRSVEELLGEVASEEVLDAVYRGFCIGK